MASTYDSQLAQIERQRRIADALRASGNEPIPPSIRTGGRFDAPVSRYEYANKALANILGAYQGVVAERKQKKLDAEDKAVLQDLLEKKRAADTPDDPLAEVVPLAPPPKTQADRQREFQVAAMRGQQFGGSAAPYAQESITRELFPKEEQPYTLNEGDVRYDKNNKEVGRGLPKQYKPPAEDRELVDIVDAKVPKGFRTIARADWKGETRYHPPQSAGVSGTLTPQQEGEVEKLAQQVFNYQIPPMPLGTRNPINAAVMARVGDMSAEKGHAYNAFEYAAKSRAMGAFSAGPEARATRGFNTMLDHFVDLRDAASKLQNGELPALNKIGNWFQGETGGSAPARFAAIKANVRGEIVKAITGGPGAEQDRQEALHAVDAANSPEQLTVALDAIEKLGVGQLGNLRRQFVASTGLDEDRYEPFLSPRAKELLAGYQEAQTKTPAPAAASGPKPGTTMVDAGVTYRFKGGDPNKQENWEPVK